MRAEEWNEGMNHIDSALVEEFIDQRDKLAGQKKRTHTRIRAGVAAACLCVIVLLTVLLTVQILVPLFRRGTVPEVPIGTSPEGPIGTLPEVPIYDSAILSASDIAALFEGSAIDGIATSSYAKMYVPSPEYLYIRPAPSDAYLTVYEYNGNDKELDSAEFKSCVDVVLSNFAKEISADTPSYEIEREAYAYGGDRLKISGVSVGEQRFFATQTAMWNYLQFSNKDHAKGIVLGGVPIEIDQTQTDEEIIASLSQVRDKLCSVCNVTFSDIKIFRKYDRNSEYKATAVWVYLYNEADHPLNAMCNEPVSDHITLYFDNFENYAGDVVSDTILRDVCISCYQYRATPDERYAASVQAKMIPLADAEALLYNGYVFGGHSCPLCMAAQREVDFENYDFAGFTYMAGYDKNDSPTKVIPFYVFYKDIGTSENGNRIYAMTYVPAVEVSGYTEYFESQTSKHRPLTVIDGVESVE